MSGDPDISTRARDWWLGLQHDNAARARLRRARTPLDALLEPQTYNLMQRLGWHGDRGERVAALAAVLAHVREDDPQRIARAIGRKKLKDEDSALVSEGRFRRLMTERSIGDLQTSMKRLVDHLGGRASVADLTYSMLWWSDKTRTNWAYDYYAAGDASSDPAEKAQKVENG